MSAKLPFFDEPEWTSIVDNINGIYTSDGTIVTLLDFERVLDEADIYAFKNWNLGELVDGPNKKKYSCDCTFMWPYKLMPNPQAVKRLLTLGCSVKFRRTEIESPIKVEKPSDYKPGTHYPKLKPNKVWLVHITIPLSLMNDIREGSIDLADQTIDLSDLEDAYVDDLHQEKQEDGQAPQTDAAIPGQIPEPGTMGGGLGAPPVPAGGPI